MNGLYVWRFPTLPLAGLVVSLLLSVLLWAGLTIRERVASAVLRGTTSAALVLLCMSALPLTAVLYDALTQSAREAGTYIDYSAGLVYFPILLALGALVVTLTPIRGRRPGPLGTTSVLIFIYTFLAANLINRCQPGWCNRYGIPFTWHESGDAIVEWQGETRTTSGLWPLSANGATLILGIALLRTRKRTGRANAA